MAERLISTRRKKTGLPPGTPVHIGEPNDTDLRITVFDPRPETVKEIHRVETRPFLRDLYDHVIHLIELIESFQEIVSGAMEIYLSSISNRMNNIMKVLTIISTIFIPLTFIAGVYGMNFALMPELELRWGYPITLAVMVGIAAIMLRFFRSKKWI